MKSADRSLAMLELLAAQPEGATFAQVAEALSLPRSSAHGLLQTLIGRRYVEVVDGPGRERRYRLGLKLVELSAAQTRGHGLLARARPAVAELAARCGETVHLAVLDGAYVVYLLAEEGEHTMRLISPLGRRVPAYAAATGKVLLAGQPDGEVVRRLAPLAEPDPEGSEARLPPLTWRTVRTLPDLLRELDEVRRLGHAHDVEGYLEGVHCVAAPIFAAGIVTAALSISIPTPRLDSQRLKQLVSLLVHATAARISQPAPSAVSDDLVGKANPVTREGNAEMVAGLCTSASTERGPAGSWREGDVRVGWSMGQMLLPSFRAMHRMVCAAAPGMGAGVLWTDAYDDPHKQACDVDRLLACGAQVLVIHPVHTIEADALFRAAAAAGVPSICVRRPARSNAFTLYAGANTFQQGALQIDFVAERLGGRGTVVLLEGDPYNDNARNIAEGNRRALDRSPGLRLLAHEVCPGWSRTQAGQLAAELVNRYGAGAAAAAAARRAGGRGEDQRGRTDGADATPATDGVDAIVCANDHMAGAVAEVLAARGLTGRVLVVGGDGEREAVARLHAGTQHATVFHDPAALASATLRAAVALARGEPIAEQLPRRSTVVNPPTRAVPVLDVPLRLVTQENVSELEAFWRSAADPKSV